MNITSPSRLSDTDLAAEVMRLARSERETAATLIAHLAELYARRLHQRAGYPSLFTYCTDVLRLSESAAYDRMKTAKLTRRYPEVLGMLASGRLSLTTVRLLAPYLTRENQSELLAAAADRGKRQVQEMLARRFPVPDVPSSVKKLPSRKHTPALDVIAAAIIPVGPLASAPPAVAPAPPAVGSLQRPFISPAPRPLLHPLAPDRYQVTFTTNTDTREKLELARDLLRHAIPTADAALIFARALDLLVDDLVRRKYAVTDHPRGSRGQAANSRNIPADVKRAVFIRDRGRCAFVGATGHRCGERALVEFHHRRPYGVGGAASIENIELRCRSHNAYEAELFYGGRVCEDTFSFRNENASTRPRSLG